MDQLFAAAFNHCMLYEVGPWFNANDSDTQAGLIETPLQRRKCGYVDIDGDSGGCTKFGVAQTDNPRVDIKSLTLSGSMNVYLEQYWKTGHLDQITIPIHIFQFDMCVNNGVPRASKILQQAVGATIDGAIGAQTLTRVNAQDPATLINSLSTIRATRYNTIVQNDPSQAKFLAGWLRRNSEVTAFALAQLNK